jgi:hypothetical protein
VQAFLGLTDLSAVRKRTSAAADASPNRLCANAEYELPSVDLRALPPPHLTSSVLLTGAMAVSVGADAAATNDGSGPVNTLDTGLDNLIAAHADRKLLPPPPAPVVAPGACGKEIGACCRLWLEWLTPFSPPRTLAGAIALPPPEQAWAWTYDLPAIATYLLSRYIAGRAQLGECCARPPALLPNRPDPPHPLPPSQSSLVSRRPSPSSRARARASRPQRAATRT